MRGLPQEALINQLPGHTWDGWDTQTELAAQLVELISVLATERRLQGDPRKIPRPARFTAAAARSGPAIPQGDVYKPLRPVQRRGDPDTAEGKQPKPDVPLVSGPDPEWSAAAQSVVSRMFGVGKATGPTRSE